PLFARQPARDAREKQPVGLGRLYGPAARDAVRDEHVTDASFPRKRLRRIGRPSNRRLAVRLLVDVHRLTLGGAASNREGTTARFQSADWIWLDAERQRAGA